MKNDLITDNEAAQIYADMNLSEDRAAQIRTESEKAIQQATKGHSPESLRAMFEKSTQLTELQKRIENHTTGDYTATPKPQPRIIDYNTAKIKFWIIYQHRLRLQKPVITTQNSRVLRNILAWMIGTESDLAPNKGLFIFGDFGRGKTDLIHTLKQFSYHMSKQYDNVPEWPAIRSYKAMIKKAKEEKSVKGIYQDKGISIIDDLGFQEDSTITIWGDKTDLVSEIIESRHRSWKANNGNISIFTSNLDTKRIQELHGQGISGRLIEMCNTLYWNGTDFRTLNQ